MTRTEYHIRATWPDGRSAGIATRSVSSAKEMAKEYRDGGAGVVVEVWGHAGQDMARGWYRDARRTREWAERERAERGLGYDVVVENHGSIVLLDDRTPEATAWIANNVDASLGTFAGQVVAEPRYAGDIVQAMQADGLMVRVL